MREEAARFNCEAKFARSNIVPISKHRFGRQSIKAVVDLYSVKLLDVKMKHVACSNVGTIEATAPMLIVPA